MPRQIPLTKGRFALVDDSTYSDLIKHNWHFTSQGYAAATMTINGRRQLITMHRLLVGAQPGQIVDHKNGDRLDNRRANLRLATAAQNQHNRKPNANTLSDFKGVTRFRDRWQARIRVNGKRLHLGYYDTAREAAEIYDTAARRFFRNYARTNACPGPVTPPALEGKLDRVLQGNYPRRKPKPVAPKAPKRQSPYRGVYWERGRWRAAIVVARKKLHLGYFRHELEAARAYDAAAREYRGADARLNFPEKA